MNQAELIPVGLSAWLVDLGHESSVLPLTRHLSRLRDAGGLPGVVDVVPGARTVLLDGDATGLDGAVLERAIDAWEPGAEPPATARLVEIPVVYDGADLEGVAELTGLSTREVVDHHTACEMTVAFCGFSAGFAYIAGMPPLLHLPRLDVPRTAVPAGSVAIAEQFTGVYPRRTPGGWRLLGRTDARLWDETATPPALLAPGTRVRFVER